MSGDSASPPRLIVTHGRPAGGVFDIPDGYCEIGKLPSSRVRLDQDGVSRRHASLTRAGNHIVVDDLGSTNGTYVNGRRLHSALTLRDGDRLRIGVVELRVSWPLGPRGTASYGFHDVHGPVNAGHGQQYVAGRDQFVAGRDIYGDDHRMFVNSHYDETDEIFQGRGFGRSLAILGSLIAIIGFALFGYAVVNFIIHVPDFGPGDNPFADKKLFGVPALALGFGAFAFGGVLAGIGASMSKASRKRMEEIEHLNRIRRPRQP
ncbi:FHA domain-containing protein [Streptomyces sp. 3212.3]|uniref:FHA domain-containing protein n=1 Tax=Streptomyces sp. 3212.3 TaxID=1938846 RepID=UPI000E3814A1|nr:FHA domain-containing protein [Streptomyces sp. 3212.3]REE62698.1 FHA domain-containing protein [Streptomyces sp. 3212.3]